MALVVKLGMSKSESSMKIRAEEVRRDLAKACTWPEAAREEVARQMLTR